jgi:hypothetical protein
MCFPVGVTREQVVRAVVQYIDGQPARMNENFVPLAIELCRRLGLASIRERSLILSRDKGVLG